MPNFRFVVNFYNPFADERLDPPTSAGLYQDSRIPGGLHHTVHQAKALVGAMDRDAFTTLAFEVGQLCDRGKLAGIQRLQELVPDRDYRYLDEAEELRFTLLSPDSDIPPQQWAQYMGVLALCLTAEIYCELWPSPEYEAVARAEILGTKLEPLTPRKLQEKATVAARAALLGEAFRDVIDVQNRQREAGRTHGPKAHADKHAIVAQFIDWALKLPATQAFRTTAKAAAHFIQHEMTDEQRRIANAANFHETLRKGLNNYCLDHATPHPFKEVASPKGQ